jgi:hypothetical protein
MNLRLADYDFPKVTRRTFLTTGSATLASTFLAFHPSQVFAGETINLKVSISDAQLATSGFALSTLTDPAKRQQAINTLFFCWANLSQAKPSDRDRVTAEVNQELTANKDLGDVFGKIQDFLNGGDFFSITDQPYAGELYKSLPIFTGLLDAPLGATISFASDLGASPDYGSVPATRLDAIGTIALGQVQTLLDVNSAAIPPLNQSGLHLQLGLDFSNTNQAAQQIEKSPNSSATVARTPAGTIDITTTLSNVTQATGNVNDKFSDAVSKAQSAPDPTVALKIAKEEFAKEINEVRGGVAVAAFIAGTVLGDSQAAKVISTAGTAAVNIASAIGNFAQGVTGPLGLASSLLGGFQMISSLFGGPAGPSADELILKGLNKLSSQITSFWKDMDSQLSTIEKQQSLTLDTLQTIYSTLLSTGQVLNQDLQTIEASFSELAQLNLDSTRDSYKNSLLTAANAVAQSAPLASGPDYQGIYNSFLDKINDAYTYATGTCLQSAFTGSLTGSPDPSGQNLIDRVNANPDSNNLIAVAAQIAQEYGLPVASAGALPNPNEYARGSRLFLQMNAKSLQMRVGPHVSWFRRLFEFGRPGRIKHLYQDFDAQMPTRYSAIRSLGLALRSAVIQNLTSTQIALFAGAAYLESFCADSAFRSLPGANALPVAMDSTKTVCAMIEPIFNDFVNANVLSYSIVPGSDPRYWTLAAFHVSAGPLGSVKIINSPFHRAQQLGAITLTQIADHWASTVVEIIAYRVVSKLTGAPIVPGKIVLKVIYYPSPGDPPSTFGLGPGETNSTIWYSWPDNGDFSGSNGSSVLNTQVNDFTPFTDAAQNILLTEYFTAVMRSQFAGFVKSRLTDAQLSAFIQAATRYRVIATYISRRSIYSEVSRVSSDPKSPDFDSDESCSIFNVGGWYNTDDICNGIQKTIDSLGTSIASTDWWSKLQTELTSQLRSELMDTYHGAQSCDPQRSFPAIDDTLRQLGTVAKLQGVSIPA